MVKLPLSNLLTRDSSPVHPENKAFKLLKEQKLHLEKVGKEYDLKTAKHVVYRRMVLVWGLSKSLHKQEAEGSPPVFLYLFFRVTTKIRTILRTSFRKQLKVVSKTKAYFASELNIVNSVATSLLS